MTPSFSPALVAPGGTSTLVLTFQNSAASAVTVADTNTLNLPGGVVVGAGGVTANTCNFSGSVATPGASSVTAGSGGSVPASGAPCTIAFQVVAPSTPGTSSDFVVAASAFSSSDGSPVPSTQVTTTLKTQSFQAIGLSIAGPAHILANTFWGPAVSDTDANRTFTVTLSNANNPNVAMQGVSFKFPLIDARLQTVSTTPPATTCAGGTLTINATTRMPVLSGATIPAGGSCQFTFAVSLFDRNPLGASYSEYVINPGALSTSTDPTLTNAAYDSAASGGGYTWQRGISYSKSMSPGTVANGGTVTMTLSVTSAEGYPVTYSVPDAFAAEYQITNITVAAGSNTATGDLNDVCNVPAFPASGTVTFTGTLGANVPNGPGYTGGTSCTYTITLTATGNFTANPLVDTVINTLSGSSDTGGTASVPAVTFSGDGFTSPGTIYAAAGANNAVVTIGNCAVTTACAGPSISLAQTFTGIDGSGALTTWTGSSTGGLGLLGLGGDGFFTYTFKSSDGNPITNFNWAQSFTTYGNGVLISQATTYLAAASNTCGGTFTAAAGTTKVSVAGGTIPAAGCKVTVPIHLVGYYAGGSPGISSNINQCDATGTDSAASALTLCNNGNNSLTLNVQGGAGVTNALTASNNTIAVGGNTQLVLTVHKYISVAPLDNGTFIYDLTPTTGSAVFQATSVASTTCNNGLIGGANGLQVTGPSNAALPAEQVNITGIQMPDATPAANALYNAAGGLDASAYQQQTCTITLNIKEANTVAGGFSFTASGFFGFSNRAASSGGSTTPVTGGQPTAYFLGGPSQSINTVNPSPLGVTKAFAPSPAAAGAPVTLTITVDNTTGNVVDITNLKLSDNYPTGLVNAAVPNATLAAGSGKTCQSAGANAELTAAAGGGSVVWAGGAMKAGDVCVITVQVAPLGTSVVNTINSTDLSSDQNVPLVKVSASVGTTASIGVQKIFTPNTIWSGQTSTLKLTLLNFFSTATDSGTLSLTDDLTALTGVTASGTPTVACQDASANPVTTALPTASLLAGGTQVQISGGSIPAAGLCTVSVTVTGSTPGAYTNTIAAGAMTATVSGSASSNSTAQSAPLTVLAPITISKTVNLPSSGPSLNLVGTVFNFSVACKDSTGATVSGSPFAASVTLSSNTSGSGVLDGVPAGATCTVQEASPTAISNYTWDATPPSASVGPTTVVGGSSNNAPISNNLTRLSSTIALQKSVTVTPAAPVPSISGSIAFTADCTASNDGMATGMVALSGTSGSGTITVPQGATCTVTENVGTLPSLSNYTWGSAPSPASVTLTTTSGTNPAAFTNTLSGNPASLIVTKTITGAPASAITSAISFPFTVTCSSGSYAGSIVVPAGALSADNSASPISIPAGATGCQIAEGAPSSVPSNYSWGAISYTQPTSPVAAGASLTGAIGNTLNPNPAGLTVTKLITGAPASAITSAISFPFTVTCSTPSATYSGSVTVAAGSLTGNNSANPVVIPAGSTGCTVVEGSPSGTPTNYSWGAVTYPAQPAPGALAAGDSISATISNALTQTVAGLTITKTVNVVPANAGVVANGPFNFGINCGSNGTFSASISNAGNGTIGSTSVPGIPLGSTCTITETAPASAPTGYAWVAPVAQTVTGTTASSTVNFTNELDLQYGSLSVTVSISGGPASYSASFPITTTCTANGVPVSGITPTSPTLVLAGPGTAPGTQTYANIPQGALCVLSEGTLPAPPAGYTWGTPIITPAAGATIQSTGPGAAAASSVKSAARTLAQSAAPTPASIVNPLVPVSVPDAVPVPADAKWMLGIIAACMVLVALAASRRRRRA